MSIDWLMPSNNLILCHPLLLVPSIFPSIRAFSNESTLRRWPKYLSFSLSISPSNEYSGPISFRMDQLDLLAVQGTLKSLFQHHNKLWKILKEMKIPDHLTCLLRNLYTGQEATVRPGLEKQTGSIFGKESVKAVYCYPVYLIFMQSISFEMLGWVKHKLESGFQGEISIISPQVFK